MKPKALDCNTHTLELNKPLLFWDEGNSVWVSGKFIGIQTCGFAFEESKNKAKYFATKYIYQT